MCRAERQAVFEAAVYVLQELKQAVFEATICALDHKQAVFETAICVLDHKQDVFERNAFRLAGPKSRLFHFSGAALRFYKERPGAYLNLSA